jgi:hypothetical protein
MKKLFVIVMLIIIAVASVRAQSKPKLWVHKEYEEYGDRVLFIEDLETGTRCYAITNPTVNTSGYAISCVPKSH